MDPISAGIGAVSNLIGGALTRKREDKLRQQQYEQQKEFAQSGIQWRVEDAKKAGIHPLAALGAQTHSFAAQSIGSSGFDDIAAAGQNIARGIDATRSNSQRADAYTKTLQDLQVQGLSLDNDIKRAELASKVATVRQAGNPPSMPSPSQIFFMDGQGNAPTSDGPKIEVKTRRDVADPDQPSMIPGTGPSVGYVRVGPNTYEPIIPPELAESYESDPLGMIAWMVRNRVAPNFGYGQTPNIPRGYMEDVEWDPWQQGWVTKPRRRYVK